MTCHFFTNGITDKINTVGNSVRKIIGKLSTLFIMLITKEITDGTFRRYFSESSGTIHFPIVLLITVLYRKNHWWIENHLWYLTVSENFWLNSKFKINIIDGITDRMIKNINILLSVGKCPNKKPRIPNFTTDPSPFFFFFFFFLFFSSLLNSFSSPPCSGMSSSSSFSSLSPLLLLFFSMLRYVFFFFLIFSSQFFLISILYECFFFLFLVSPATILR